VLARARTRERERERETKENNASFHAARPRSFFHDDISFLELVSFVVVGSYSSFPTTFTSLEFRVFVAYN
jgi:hypothetical protein